MVKIKTWPTCNFVDSQVCIIVLDHLSRNTLKAWLWSLKWQGIQAFINTYALRKMFRFRYSKLFNYLEFHNSMVVLALRRLGPPIPWYTFHVRVYHARTCVSKLRPKRASDVATTDGFNVYDIKVIGRRGDGCKFQSQSLIDFAEWFHMHVCGNAQTKLSR